MQLSKKLVLEPVVKQLQKAIVKAEKELDELIQAETDKRCQIDDLKKLKDKYMEETK